ncbi:unnamed protein product, partial [marine sediment metagenome]
MEFNKESRGQIQISDTAIAEIVSNVSSKCYGNKAIFESLGVNKIVDGGQSMNPSTADI